MGVTAIVIGLCLFSAAALGRSIWLWIHFRLVLSMCGPMLTWYLLNASLPAALASPPVAVLLWRAKPVGRTACLVLLGLGTLHYWLDKLFIAVNPLGRIDWPFALIVNVLLICVVSLALVNQRAQGYFQEE
jgi:hypothetical protein